MRHVHFTELESKRRQAFDCIKVGVSHSKLVALIGGPDADEGCKIHR